MDKNDENNNIDSGKSPLQFLRGGSGSQDSVGPLPSAAGMQNNPFTRPSQNGKSQGSNNTGKVFAGNSVSKSAGLWQKIKSKLLPEQAGNSARQKIMIILVPILVIVLVFLFRQVLSKAPQQSRAATEDSLPLTALNKTSGDEIHWDIPEPMPVTIRDPIKPVSQAASGVAIQGWNDSNNTDVMVVRGILCSDDKPSAVVGDRLVHLNDEIEGAKIVWIGKDSVTFEKDGEKWTKKVVELELVHEKEQTEQQKKDK